MDDEVTELRSAVIEGDSQKAVQAANAVITQSGDVYKAVIEGLGEGMQDVGKKFESGEYFIPEMMRSANASTRALDVLKPHIKVEESGGSSTVVIGTVRGDIHDIGKKIVKTVLEASGFTVHDLGVNVPTNEFIQAVEEHRPQFLLLSALTTSTRNHVTEVVDALKEGDLRDKVRVIIGGVTTSAEFAKEAGVDGYGKDALDAIKIITEQSEHVSER